MAMVSRAFAVAVAAIFQVAQGFVIEVFLNVISQVGIGAGSMLRIGVI